MRGTIQWIDRPDRPDRLWPDTPAGLYAQNFLEPLLTGGIRSYISNVYTELRVLRVDDIVLPVTIGRYHPANSYVCSPYNQYFAYSRQELGKLKNPPLEAIFRVLFKLCDLYYRPVAFDRVVAVNNWLLSTNLYPALSHEQLGRIAAFLRHRFPDRPVMFRSVDGYGQAAIYHSLLALGYRPMFSRLVHYQAPRDPALWRKKQLKIDLKLYQRRPYHLLDGSDLTPADAPRLAALYRALYLEKYSRLNPQFTEQFVSLALQKRLLTFKVFAKDGQVAAVLGYYQRNGVMTTPFFGYDRQLPLTAGLYRLLSMQVLLEGQAQGLLINASAGVGQFKRVRGAIPVVEYNMVDDRGLPAGQRQRWSILKLVLDYLAGPLIQKYEL
jgi:hypothetical protein